MIKPPIILNIFFDTSPAITWAISSYKFILQEPSIQNNISNRVADARMPASHLSQVHHLNDLAEAALNHMHDCAWMMIPLVQHVRRFFPPNAICHFSAQDFKKPSSQAAKINQIETAVHLNILEPWTMAYHMAVMAAAPHMYCGRGFGLLWEDVSTQTRPLPRLTPKITNGEKRNLRGLVFFGLSRLGLTLTLRRSITLAGLGRFWFGTALTSNR